LYSGKTEKCPHCSVVNRFESIPSNRFGPIDKVSVLEGEENTAPLMVEFSKCTNCHRLVLSLDYKLLYPLGTSRAVCPDIVPESIKNDYTEACLIERLSPKGSAALARRCLQNMLRDRGIVGSNLSQEIESAMENLPSHLAGAIDSIRNIGNFSAHPMKSKSTGEIADVESGEVEWCLDVIEQLFDFYYVQPDNLARKKKELNKKLADLGKPAIK
jgi:hypothetical protein